MPVDGREDLAAGLVVSESLDELHECLLRVSVGMILAYRRAIRDHPARLADLLQSQPLPQRQPQRHLSKVS